MSYNDPQGNRRFITPVTLSTVTDDLTPYSGQMIPDLGLSITTNAPFDQSGSNTTYYITNSPDEHPIENAHLFVEYIQTGEVQVEQVYTQTLQPGPTVWPVIWDTSIFPEPFTTISDYTILAYWTDFRGDIIDTSVRPLVSFQEDPLAQAETTNLLWNFGSVEREQP